MNATPQLFASLRLSRSVPHLVKRCHIILDKMSNDPAYASPPIPYATATAHLEALFQAELSVRREGAGDRNAKLLLVRADMRLYKAFVQALADADLTNARTLIEGAAMVCSTRDPGPKPGFAVRDGAVPGRVHLAVKAPRRRASYYWQMRPADAEAAWVDLPETVEAKTTIDGLTPATIVEFRFRVLTRDGYSGWSSPISIIVR